jgi:hypothetical protein
MAVLRFISSVLLLVAVIAFIADVTRMHSGATGGLDPATIAKQWNAYAPASLTAAKATVTRATHPLVWTFVVSPALNTPVFLLFGLAALVTGYLGRRRKRINIYVN